MPHSAAAAQPAAPEPRAAELILEQARTIPCPACKVERGRCIKADGQPYWPSYVHAPRWRAARDVVRRLRPELLR